MVGLRPDTRLRQCRWPALAPPFDAALREAVAFVFERFETWGIIAAGTIVRGNPHPGSDLDMVVIHARPRRQRIQKRFQGVPAEIFVNPPHTLRDYFEQEFTRARPCTAHMLNTGFVVFNGHAVVAQLLREARAALNRSPQLAAVDLTRLRYAVADQFENAFDMLEPDPDTARMLLTGAVQAALRYLFRRAGRYLPRDKDLLREAAALHPKIGLLTRAFLQTRELPRQATIARQIADLSIGARGFFEWESPLEDVGDQGMVMATPRPA